MTLHPRTRTRTRAVRRPYGHGTRARHRRRRLVPAAGIILLLAAAASVGQLALGGEADRQGDAATARPAHIGEWRGLGVELGGGLRPVTAARDHALWVDATRTHTVTVGAAPSSSQPLEQLARDAGAALAASVPGGRFHGVEGGDGGSAVRATVSVPGDRGRRVTVVQAWQRLPTTRLDAIATYTSSDGTWPVPPARMGVLGE